MLPIITSLLDTDWYQFTQANLIFAKNYSDIPIKYQFKNRTDSIDLGNWIDCHELKKQIDYILELKFADDELEWLSQFSYFSSDFINALKVLQLTTPNIIEHSDRFYGIEIEGGWFNSIFWETYLLSIVNQLFNKKYTKYMAQNCLLFDPDMMLAGVSRLENKITTLRLHPDITFMEFGTRRRFSTRWQEYVIKRLKSEIPDQMIGTSNAMYAKQLGLKPIGTIAHQAFMVYAALYNEDLERAQDKLILDWYGLYGGPMSIFLTDTFGTDFFLKTLPEWELINTWGFRVDSGDPFVIGNKIVEHYRKRGISPQGKMLVFSDGLTVDKMIALHEYFSPLISVGFGIGTNMTNDLGVQNLSIVIKSVEANGMKICKLSDNIAKAIGEPEIIEKYKRIVRYDNEYKERCVY